MRRSARRAPSIFRRSRSTLSSADRAARSPDLTGNAREASIAPSVLAPIFQAGQIRAGVRLTQAQEREALIAYRQTIMTGLREASDALVANDRTREQVDRGNARKSADRNRAPLHPALPWRPRQLSPVLDAERNLFRGQLTLAQFRMMELQSVVHLYQALGGGWQ